MCISREPFNYWIGRGENFIASDSRAFLKHTQSIQALASGELAIVGLGNEVETYNFALKRICKQVRQVTYTDSGSDKQGYSYYMLKEIYEQPEVLERLVHKYIDPQGCISEKFYKVFL